MLKRELKINFKSFLIWTSVLIALFLVVYLMYPSIMKSNSIQMMDEMMEMFPKEVLVAFNMDISSMDTAYGWLKTEGFVFALIIVGIYAGILGSNILLKEESDKTIEYLNSLPIKRGTILIHKVICGISYIFLMIAAINIFNYVGLKLSGEFDVKQYWLLSITPLFSALPIFAIALFISTFFHKTKKTFGIGLGIAIVSYFIQVLAEMNEKAEYLKYFTVYTLSDIRNVIIESAINPLMIVLSIFITMVFVVFAYIEYDKKELV